MTKKAILAGRQGFTLIELLLYVAILAIMLTALIPFIGNVLVASSKNSIQQEVSSNARVVSEKIKSQIRQATAITSVSSPATSATVVQHSATSVTNTAVTGSITVSATGATNLLVVGTTNGGGRTIVSVSDGTNSFTQFPGVSGTGSGGSVQSDIWYLASSTAGKTTMTVTYSGSVGSSFEKDIWFWEVSGFSSAGVDVGAKVDNGVQSGGVATGAVVNTTSTKGFIVGINMTNNVVSANPQSGNEFISGGDITSTSNAGCSLVSTTAALHQPAWTDNGTSFVSSTAAFKETGGGTLVLSGSTTIDLSGGQVRINSVPINSSDTTVTNLVFVNGTSADNKTKNISFSFTISSNLDQTRKEYQNLLNVEGAAELRSN